MGERAQIEAQGIRIVHEVCNEQKDELEGLVRILTVWKINPSQKGWKINELERNDDK